ncbi:Tetratricopeptide repeat-containing protein [Belliella buryatensis]|uniref:Tetratricopeptide repeat-containing protein n=1 Tax=Belliella buryatensis TaxID=1500549 RepID=A0A239H3J6_9BACT|nr:tetratricopeptide repeat protein [Belliella buryatensis]SNS75383.1 Tetratricopeptide repeat-containing protein [Belliella buryatensis]
MIPLFQDKMLKIIWFKVNQLIIVRKTLPILLIFYFLIPPIVNVSFAYQNQETVTFELENMDLFNLSDSSISILQEQFPMIKKNLATKDLELFLEEFEIDQTLPKEEDAEILKVIYVQHNKKLKKQTKINLLLKLAYIYNRQIKSKEVIATLEELKHYDLSESELALSQYYFGLAEQDKSNFETALSYYLKALPVFEKQKDQKNLTGIYSDLGRLYNSNKDYKKSINYYLKAVSTAETMMDTSLIAKTYSNIGTTYERMQEDELAIEFYIKGMELSKVLQDSLKLAQNLLNIGNVYTKLKNYPKAHEYYLQSLVICQQKNIAYGKLLNYLNMGFNAKDWGKYDLGLAMTDSGLQQIDLMDLPLEKVSLLQNKSEILANMGKFENAYLLLLEAEKLEKEIFDQEKQARIEELTVKYETTIKQKELENANLQIKSSEQSIRFLIILFCLILIATAVLVAFYRSRAMKIKALYLKNLEILATYKNNRSSIKKQIDEKIIPNKNSDQFEQLFEQINHLLIQEEAYKDADFNLNSLAQQVKSNSKYVSQAIQQETSKNFNTYINHLRVMEAQKLIQESYKDINLNLTDVMYACGFKSRSTFYTAFQKETGMSPKQYKDLALSDIGKQFNDTD